MATGRKLTGKKLPLTIAFTVLLVAAFGAGCKGFFQPPTLNSISINPTSPSVQLTQTATLQAYGVNSNGQGAYLTSGVSWSSSDDTIATVTGTGSATLTGIALGTVTITAASESVTNTASATVYITVSGLTITPPAQSILSGATTTDPYIITANGSIDISSSATLTAYTSYPGGTQVTTLSCAYDASGPAGAGQYCSDDGTTPAGGYKVVATYTGTTDYAIATLNVN
jgi:hypothetical protein